MIRSSSAWNLFNISIGILILSIIGICQQTLEDPVQKYSTEDFHANIIGKNHYVLFYIPWHGDTKSILPIWEEIGQKYNKADSDVKIVKVDCVQEKDLCTRQDVSDSPTIKLYKVGGDQTGIRYRGIRDFHSLEQFMNTGLNRITADFVYGARIASPPPTQKGLNLLQDENFEEAVQNGNSFINFCTPWSTKCMDLDPIWKELAKEFQYDDDIIFGVVDCTHHKKTCNENEVRGYPSLLWLEDGILVEKYPSKERDIDSLRTYIFKKLGKDVVSKPSVKADTPFRTAAFNLDTDSFHSTLESNKLVLVNFMTPWCSPCQTLEPKWEELAVKFKDGSVIKIARVDCTRNKAICDQENVDEFPAIRLFRNGLRESHYTGPHKIEDLTDYCKAAAEFQKVEL